MYALYLYFLELSFRSTAKALDPFVEKRSHVAVWNWVQLFHPNKFYLKRTRVTAFIIDETILQIGSEYAWLWVDIEPVHKQVIGEPISTYHFLELDTSFPLILKALPYPLIVADPSSRSYTFAQRGPVSEFTCDFVVNCDDSEAETTASIIRLTLTFSNSFVILLKNRSAASIRIFP